MRGIVLIGPSRVGKSAVGRHLAGRLALPFHDLSSEAHRYRAQTDFDPERRAACYRADGFEGMISYMMPINARVVELALADYGPSVVELGALQSIYDTTELLDRVRCALNAYGDVVLLLPFIDEARSLQALRVRSRLLYHGTDWNTFFVTNPSNRRLAKHVVYTRGQTPEETVDGIIARLNGPVAPVMLLGPVGVGKTTVAALLGSRLNLPVITMDAVRRRYYAEVGYTEEEEETIRNKQGFGGVLDYWKRFDLHAIRRAIEDHPDSVVDFGAGQTVFVNTHDLEAAEVLFAPYPNVFLLLPSPSTEESVGVLADRMRRRTAIGGIALDRYTLTHRANRILATVTVYAEAKPPEGISDEILARLSGR